MSLLYITGEKIFLYGLVILVLISACTKKITKDEKDLRLTGEEKTSLLIETIERINANSAQSFYADFDIEGHSGNQKFKVSGNARYNNLPRKMRVVFHDAVFKSTLNELILEDDIIKLYFPFDKVLYIDNFNTINVKSYSGVDLDFALIYDLTSGRIPVVRNYTVRKGLESREQDSSNDNKLVILENNEYFETISFLNNIPDKIKLLNKKNKECIEIYYTEPIFENNSVFYKGIKVVSPDSDLKITVQFTTLKLSDPVELSNIGRIKLPVGVKIIKRD